MEGIDEVTVVFQRDEVCVDDVGEKKYKKNIAHVKLQISFTHEIQGGHVLGRYVTLQRFVSSAVAAAILFLQANNSAASYYYTYIAVLFNARHLLNKNISSARPCPSEIRQVISTCEVTQRRQRSSGMRFRRLVADPSRGFRSRDA